MTPARIMIVEDEHITAADIEETLSEIGYQIVAVVDNGRDALRRAEQEKPDLVLMDIRLKGAMDGVETAVTLRQQFDIPVVYLTAHADDQTIDRAKLAEPLGYVVKPFIEVDLKATIEVALFKSKQDANQKSKGDELESTLSSLSAGVIRTDSRNRIEFLNPAAEQWTGWRSADAVGRELTEVLQLRDRKMSRGLEEFLRRSLRSRVATELPENASARSRDGVERAVTGSIGPVLDHLDHPCGAVVVFCEHAGEGEPLIAKPTRGGDQPPTDVIADSPAMQAVLKFAERIATSGVSTILLQGESGVGKDVMAKYLHRRSDRYAQPFIALNCAAIPDTLLESEIFSYEKGAFTDARSQKKGVLDSADGGTLFLDEIGELQPHLQAKLLRVLDEQNFRRLGGVHDVQVDVRIITATNKNLAQAVRDREFREDLYYRLNVIQVAIPPLRERTEDIRPLAEHFVKMVGSRLNRTIEGFSNESLELLMAHRWPGNVRELRNVVERAMVLEDSSTIQSSSLILDEDPLATEAVAVTQPGRTLEEVERAMLENALRDCNGNQSEAARKLGITRDTLRYRMKKFQVA